MAGNKGLKPQDRKLATTTKKRKLTANQWQNTPQQNLFMFNWITPNSPTFGNAYESAIQAKYSRHYAMKLTAPTTLNQWISEYRSKLEFGPEHVKQLLQSLALQANNSRSPDDTRVKSLEILSKVFGMTDNKGSTTNIIVQPILNGSSVPNSSNTYGNTVNTPIDPIHVDNIRP